jgi:hypothetical protein
MIQELALTLFIIGTLGAIISIVVIPLATLASDAMEDQPDLLDWTPPAKPEFDGSTIEPEDGARLQQQLARVYALMRDGKWRTLDEISEATGDSPQSVSARLRDLRKPKFGGHDVQRDRIGKGLFAYRLAARAEAA